MTHAHQLQARAFLLWEQAKDHTKSMRYEAAADLRSQAFEMALMAEEKCESNPRNLKLNPPKYYRELSRIEKATRAVKKRYLNLYNNHRPI